MLAPEILLQYFLLYLLCKMLKPPLFFHGNLWYVESLKFLFTRYTHKCFIVMDRGFRFYKRMLRRNNLSERFQDYYIYHKRTRRFLSISEDLYSLHKLGTWMNESTKCLWWLTQQSGTRKLAERRKKNESSFFSLTKQRKLTASFPSI